MDRFVAMIWDPTNNARFSQIEAWSKALQRSSPKWCNVLDAQGLRVYSLIQRGDTPIVTKFQDVEGVIIGPIFERGRERNGRPIRIDRADAERIVETGGTGLIKNFWGNYVALWREQEGRRIYVLRDPCGAVPCFMSQVQGIDLFFSHAEDVAQLPDIRFTVDWDYLRSFILFNYFVTRFTGLNEITELLGGERLELAPDGRKSFFWVWNGAEVAAEPHLQSFDDAAAELRATTEACFTAWGKEYRSVVVSLSGGLDSSILVNLLRRTSDAQITGLHYLGAGYEQYEVRFARLAAARAGIPLVEAAQDPTKDQISRILDAPRGARPKLQSLAVLIDELSTHLAQRVNADAYMIGQGGDNLFLQRGGAKYTLVDYVAARGSLRDAGAIAYSAAMMQKRSVWGVVSDATHHLLRRRHSPYAFLEDVERTSLSPLTRSGATTIPTSHTMHPWCTNTSRLAPGKVDHVLSIIGLYNYYIHHGRGLSRDVSYPFFSQPIVEFALRTPTFLLCAAGVDRAIERAAFRDLIPDEIVRRTSKGGANFYQLQVMQMNHRFIRDLILNGTLIRQHWIDRNKVEAMLSPNYVLHGGGATFIYLLAAVEGWLSSWQGAASRAVA